MTFAVALILAASTGAVAQEAVDCTKVTGSVLWWTEWETPEGQAAQDEIFVQGLEAAYPGIDLEIVCQGEHMRTVVRTAVMGGAGPESSRRPAPPSLSHSREAASWSRSTRTPTPSAGAT